jgi:hypothetical protein
MLDGNVQRSTYNYDRRTRGMQGTMLGATALMTCYDTQPDWGSKPFLRRHLVCAAFFAIARRCSEVKFFFRAFPPKLPR